MANVIKRDGQSQGFDINKLIASIELPLQLAGIDDPVYVLSKAMYIQDKVYAKGEVPSSEIEEMAIKALMDFGNVDAVKRYILW